MQDGRDFTHSPVAQISPYGIASQGQGQSSVLMPPFSKVYDLV
jgi:hypothetical protein